jgi:hypothetical protein
VSSGSATCHRFQPPPPSPLPLHFPMDNIWASYPPSLLSVRMHTSDFGKRRLVFDEPSSVPPNGRLPYLGQVGIFAARNIHSGFLFQFVRQVTSVAISYPHTSQPKVPLGTIPCVMTSLPHSFFFFAACNLNTCSFRTCVREPSSLEKLVASFVIHLPPYVPFQYDISYCNRELVFSSIGYVDNLANNLPRCGRHPHGRGSNKWCLSSSDVPGVDICDFRGCSAITNLFMILHANASRT